ncbi:MAG: prepilin-type N-terminal cleavage/methylation domain-containing protein [Bacillota bacterium]
MIREKGLTLVEIVVALLILSLILGTAGNLYLQGVLGWQRQDYLLEAQDNLRVAMDRLCRELRQAQRLDGASHSAELIFYILYPDDEDHFTERKVHYYLKDNVLYRIWKGVPSPLASNITGLQLEYAPESEPAMSKKNLVTVKLSGRVKNGIELTLQSKIRIRAVNP